MTKSTAAPELVSYQHLGYEAEIELNWTTFCLEGPDHLVISITRLGRPEHTMRVSVRYRSKQEAIEAGQKLVRHYISVVTMKLNL
jgi:hypothetical protein